MLFHYNGHGVPRPTSNGELWMFNPVRRRVPCGTELAASPWWPTSAHVGDMHAVGLLCVQHYTQYVPVSVYDLQQWCTSPSVFVLACSSAGILLPHFASVDRNPGDAEVRVCTRARASRPTCYAHRGVSGVAPCVAGVAGAAWSA